MGKKETTRKTVKGVIENTFPNADEELRGLIIAKLAASGANTVFKLKRVSQKIGDNAIKLAFYQYAVNVMNKMINNEEIDKELKNYIEIYATETNISFPSLISPKGCPLLGEVIHSYYDNRGIETIKSKFEN